MHLLNRATVAGKPLRDRRSLFVGELDAGELLGGGDHLLGDRRPLLRLVGLSPEDTGQERGAEPDGGEVRHEGAAVVSRVDGHGVVVGGDRK